MQDSLNDTIIPNAQELSGIKTVIPDKKGRITVPTEWRNTLKPNTSVILLSTGNYLLIIPKQYYQQTDSDLIAIEEGIDGSGRILIGKGVKESFSIKLEDVVWMIGRWNHLEVYFQHDKFQNAIKRSRQAAIVFQAKLIGVLK